VLDESIVEYILQGIAKESILITNEAVIINETPNINISDGSCDIKQDSLLPDVEDKDWQCT